jgi:hypothetical protein
MIIARGYCHFCGRHAEACRGGLYVPGSVGRVEVGAARICLYCIRTAFREFGEAEPQSREVVVLRRLQPVEPQGPRAA